MNKLFIDTESWADQICELAYVLADGDLNILEEKSIKIKPKNMAANNTFALPYSTIEISKFPELNPQEIRDVLYKGEVYGFSFNNDLRALMKEALEVFEDDKSFKYYELHHHIEGCGNSLKDLLNHYGVEFNQNHSALDDARAALDLYKKSNIAREVSAPIHPIKVKLKKKKLPNKNNSKEDRIKIAETIIRNTPLDNVKYIISTECFNKLKSFGFVKGFVKKSISKSKGVKLFNIKKIEQNLEEYKLLYPNVKVLYNVLEIKKELRLLS